MEVIRRLDIDLEGTKSMLSGIASELCVPYYIVRGCTKKVDLSTQLYSALDRIEELEKKLNGVVGIAKILLDFHEAHNDMPEKPASDELGDIKNNFKPYSVLDNLENSKVSVECQTDDINDNSVPVDPVQLEIEFIDVSKQDEQNKLLEKIQDYEQLVQDYMNQIESYKIQIADYEAEVQTLKDESEQINDDLSSAQMANKDLELKISEVTRSLRKTEAKYEELKTENESSKLKSSYNSYAAYSRRCQATTLKGTQCLRNAQAGSSYCWQH